MLLRLNVLGLLLRRRGGGVGVGVVRGHLLACGGGEGSSCGSEGLMGSEGVEDYDMALFEVFDEGVEIGEVEPTACVITALRWEPND